MNKINALTLHKQQQILLSLTLTLLKKFILHFISISNLGPPELFGNPEIYLGPLDYLGPLNYLGTPGPSLEPLGRIWDPQSYLSPQDLFV